MMGTNWVAPREGATVQALIDSCELSTNPQAILPYLEDKTALELTNRPIADYDCIRALEAIKRVVSKDGKLSYVWKS